MATYKESKVCVRCVSTSRPEERTVVCVCVCVCVCVHGNPQTEVHVCVRGVRVYTWVTLRVQRTVPRAFVRVGEECDFVSPVARVMKIASSELENMRRLSWQISV